MKKILKLFYFVIFVAVIITVTQYETFTLLFAGEWCFLSSVFGDFLAWTGTIIFWKYVIVALSLCTLLFMGTIKFIKRFCKKGPERKKPDKKTVAPNKSKLVKTDKANTSSPGKFKRV